MFITVGNSICRFTPRANPRDEKKNAFTNSATEKNQGKKRKEHAKKGKIPYCQQCYCVHSHKRTIAIQREFRRKLPIGNIWAKKCHRCSSSYSMPVNVRFGCSLLFSVSQPLEYSMDVRLSTISWQMQIQHARRVYYVSEIIYLPVKQVSYNSIKSSLSFGAFRRSWLWLKKCWVYVCYYMDGEIKVVTVHRFWYAYQRDPTKKNASSGEMMKVHHDTTPM